jgi:probable S-adenosylmethionine-dependent methyltransferase, YraL family
MSSNSGTLWIVATPLGNPGDLSPRAREVLGGVDGILAEDTRRAGLLLARCNIAAPAFTSLHDHNEEERLPRLLAWLKEGKNLALISDAGTPLLSDPGYRLVRACRREGIRVSPVPGPSAPVAALSASGLPPQPFAFLGFLPRKGTERQALFASFANLDITLIFFERKDRLNDSLADAFAALGLREVCIARELTKTYEEFLFFPLEDHTSLPDSLLGEITVLIGPPPAGRRSPLEEADAVLAEEAAQGGKARDIARRAQRRLPGWTGKELYRRLQEQGEGEET